MPPDHSCAMVVRITLTVLSSAVFKFILFGVRKDNVKWGKFEATAGSCRDCCTLALRTLICGICTIAMISIFAVVDCTMFTF